MDMFSVLLLWPLMATVSGLQCYKCENFETESSSSLLEPLNSDSNPNCDKEFPFSAQQVTCPDEINYKCGTVKGTATFSVPLFGSFTIGTTLRDCMPVISGTPDGCVDDGSEANKLIKDVLNLLLSIFVSGLSVDGNICYCSTDLCHPTDDRWCLAGFCFEIWLWCLIGLGILAAPFVLTCCCCCCCGACCKSSQTAPANPQPMVVMATAPGMHYGQPAQYPGHAVPAGHAQNPVPAGHAQNPVPSAPPNQQQLYSDPTTGQAPLQKY